MELDKMNEKTATELKQTIKPKETKPLLSDPDVKKHLEGLYQKFVIVTIYKASNYFIFIYTKYCISKQLVDISPNKNKNSASAYSHTQEHEEKAIKTSIKHSKKLILIKLRNREFFPYVLAAKCAQDTNWCKIHSCYKNLQY